MSKQVETVTVELPSIADLMIVIASLTKRIEVLETPTNTAQKEMTDEHAKLAIESSAKHNDFAKTHGLSYGQVYSCRLGYTFKHVHKALKEAGVKNAWIK